VNWRTAFVIIGMAGVPVAGLIWAFVPERAQSASPPPADAGAGFLETAAQLARKPSFWLLSFGAASASICGYGLGFWIPSYFNASLGLSLAHIGSYFGSIVLVGGSAGILFGGWLTDRLGTARPSAFAGVPAIAFLLTAPLYVAALFVPSLTIGWLLFALPFGLSLVWLGPIINAVQSLVRPAQRATASASFLLINNLIGIGFGTFIFGYMSDLMRASYGADSLRYSILYGLGFYLLAALLCGLAALRLGRDLVDDKS
jgi:predicted MFS family arabinose efflux permease